MTPPMHEQARRRPLVATPLGLLGAFLLVLSVALSTALAGGDWFATDGAPLATREMYRLDLRTDDGTMPPLAGAFVVVYSAATPFAAWLLALAAWPVRLWSRAVMAVLLVLAAAAIVLVAQDATPGAEASTSDAYVLVGTGLVLAAVMVGMASWTVARTRSRWVRCAVAAAVVSVMAVGSAAGFGELLGASDALSITSASIGFVLSLVAAAMSLVVMAVATRRYDAVSRVRR